MKNISRKTQSSIRAHLGHGEGNRKVVIKRSGEVHYYGSTDHFDRSNDFWHFGGYVEDIVAAM